MVNGWHRLREDTNQPSVLLSIYSSIYNKKKKVYFLSIFSCFSSYYSPSHFVWCHVGGGHFFSNVHVFYFMVVYYVCEWVKNDLLSEMNREENKTVQVKFLKMKANNKPSLRLYMFLAQACVCIEYTTRLSRWKQCRKSIRSVTFSWCHLSDSE